jgi:hypothetical protein
MIILNEKDYAEKCLKEKIISDKPFFTLSILAKYYYHCFGYRKKKITELLTEFIQITYPLYEVNKSMWNDTIEKIAKNAGKFTLYEIEGVWITKKELETIENIHNKVLERLAFTLLCLAKLANARNPKNTGWVNNDAKEVFSLARISCSVTNRYERLGELYRKSLLELPKRIDNLSVRVTYIDNESENVLFISDFRELGYEYLKYKGDNFIRCQDCGILIRNNKAGTKKYCSNCVGYTPMENKTVLCVDCGKEFKVDPKNNQTCRCSDCYTIYRANRKLETQRIRRENDKMKSEQFQDKL